MGGGVSNFGTLIVTNSTFSGNLAQGGAGGNGLPRPATNPAMIGQAGTATFIDSTFSANKAQGGNGGEGSGGGGGGAGLGAAIFMESGQLKLTSVTLSDNDV